MLRRSLPIPSFLFNICQNFEKAPTPNCVETQHDAETKTTAPSPMYVIDHHDNDRCSRGGGDLEDSMNYGWIILGMPPPPRPMDRLRQPRRRYHPPVQEWWLLPRIHLVQLPYHLHVLRVQRDQQETRGDLHLRVLRPHLLRPFLDLHPQRLPHQYVARRARHALACPHTDTTICSSHGICLYDDVTQTARCMCNSGYTGDDCGSSMCLSMSLIPVGAFIGLSASDCFYIANSIALLAVICTMYVVSRPLHK